MVYNVQIQNSELKLLSFTGPGDWSTKGKTVKALGTDILGWGFRKTGEPGGKGYTLDIATLFHQVSSSVLLGYGNYYLPGTSAKTSYGNFYIYSLQQLCKGAVVHAVYFVCFSRPTLDLATSRECPA